MKNYIFLFIIVVLISSFIQSKKEDKGLYGYWKASSIYLGANLEGEISDLNLEQNALFINALDSVFLANSFIELEKNGKCKIKTFGGEFEGHWKMEKYIVKLFPTKDEKDSIIVEVKPDRLVLLFLPEKGITITYVKVK